MARKMYIVGGGLAGLTAAATAARSGAEVVVLEARTSLGGRARTEERNGFLFNQGAHALYAGGVGISILRELGVTVVGKQPALKGYGQLRGKVGLMPGTPMDLVRSPLLGVKAKAQLGRLLAKPLSLLKTETANRSMQQWVEEQVSHPEARLFVLMAARTATYQDDMTTIAAAVAVPQTVSALTKGVLYLDGGWKQLVEKLEDVAIRAGAKIDTESKVASIRDVPDADAIVLAVGGPGQVAKLLDDNSSAANEWARRAQPVYASGLDLGLARLPTPERRFCLCADAPLYFSTHTPTAELAPEGSELVHVLAYGTAHENPRVQMEEYLDAVQPGWKAEVRAEQFGKHWLVAHDRPTPEMGSLTNRPGPGVPGYDNVFIAGDWVGAHGLLADASIASGREAGHLASSA